ncbi:hypothetical protein ACFQ8C_10530 [Streptomyces sp. NPDC056503]|uniref:hypothetical protein n=1 Tax=Streptomyces sp. NPDC056503 TaxID=3345842 RepID=UPI00368954DB
MGYDLHVTRRDPWWAEEGPEIAAREWDALVAADPALGASALWWHDGRVVAKDPAPEDLAALRRVAVLLGARVQGDDGEFHDGPAPGPAGIPLPPPGGVSRLPS